MPTLTDDILSLVRCESPSSDLAAVARSARAIAALGTARLGVAPELLVVDGCTHVRWTFGPGPTRVLLIGHHDTVWPVGSLAAHPAEVSGGILRGPGCLDMKAGVAMAIHALAALRERDGVALLVTGDEEIGSRSSRALIAAAAEGCEAVLVLEPAADGRLKVARKGRSHYEVAITGRAAHAGLEPEKGVNAALELARQVVAVDGLADPAHGTTVTPGVLRAGRSSNTVADAASFSIDVRSATTAELDRVDAALRALRPTLAEARVSVDGGIDRPPLERSASDALFALAAELAPGAGIDGLEGAAVGGGSDGSLTAAQGIPTLDGLGAIGDGLHAEHEHVVLDALPGRTALVALLASRLLDEGVPA
ncbi:M20 family metallopeptidase [Baekduia alba]|uniref:M20 family metallopeptidase n=1 Tax=Baekduia alba TaxID=2997333 RepID=UPI003D7A9F90